MENEKAVERRQSLSIIVIDASRSKNYRELRLPHGYNGPVSAYCHSGAFMLTLRAASLFHMRSHVKASRHQAFSIARCLTYMESKMLTYQENLLLPKFAIPHPIKVVAFDCDGVLFDSKDANIRFYNHILEYVGYPSLLPEHHEFIHMHPVRKSLEHLLKEETAFERAWDYCQRIDFHEFNRYLRCEPGLIDILEGAKESYGIAMATNRTVSTRDVLVYFDLEKYFDLVVSASDVSCPKPHPESMERILEFFGASPEEVLYVGDSLVDEGLASSSGVYFAAYKNHALKAHIHLSHFHELLPVLFPEGPENCATRGV